MFTTPRRATLPIFTNYDSKPDTGTTLAIFATLTQFQHAITQFVAHYPSSRRGRCRNLDRGCSRRRAILRRNHNPRSVATLLVATLLVVTVAAWPWLALRSDGSASSPANNGADCSPAPTTQCST